MTLDVPIDYRRTVSALSTGRNDPTTQVGPTELWHATHTPEGPGVVHLRWDAHTVVDVASYGPGGGWLERRVDAMTGRLDRPEGIADAPPVVERALRNGASRRLVATKNPFHCILPTILAQRITGREAANQWVRLVRELGTPVEAAVPAPPGLMYPPEPQLLARRPLWSFHALGIEQHRARTLVNAGRHAERMWQWADEADRLFERLQLIPGVGPWTAGYVCRVAAGDPDRVIVGDFHFPHAVGWHLTGAHRSSDDEMVALLERFAPQRGRVQRDLVALGAAPAHGPRRRVLRIEHM